LSDSLTSLTVTALPGIPLVQRGDDLTRLVLDGMARAGLAFQAGDALVVTSKIVSKAEGRLVDLNSVTPSDEAIKLADETQKDARIVELILRESVKVSRKAPNILVVEHKLGFVSANAGIDQSNVNGDEDCVLLLPSDPDTSARRMGEQLREATGVDVAIIISDSHGRPFRVGNIGVAIGVAGMPAVLDLRGRSDLFGRKLRISVQAYGDMVASAANLVSGEADEGRPVVLVRGLQFPPLDGSAKDLNRAVEFDLYR
jgi:coenzyme F420-0:L-glutamate ligase / coenzyme F420-1:gamma-L-glutamate ligase